MRCSLRIAVGLPQLADETLHVMMEIPSAGHLGRVAMSKRLQSFGQIVGGRHRGAVDQHRPYPHALRERFFNLDSDEILERFNSRSRPNPSQPILPDHREDDVGVADAVGDILGEIDACRNAVDVHEDSVFAESFGEPVANAARNVTSIVSSVGN